MATKDERQELRGLAKEIAVQAMAVTDLTIRRRLLTVAARVEKMGAEASD